MNTRQRHVPLRRCVACGTRLPQRELIRIVRTPQGQVSMDPGHKAAGRGAYLCHSRACWEQALKKKRLDHALRRRMSPEEQQFLQESAKAMVQQA